ncbi:Cenp-O kinetochore centromere component-domain-containing protein [Boeremia exigua]|uniref:Cenp-O kinetochore centromere component-domain-containing protein n=1 Tax=Boeremia exigua TaxID=749465 RepID=UPI001E8E6417|nr:Cenp-O kinetochore centromere component-domain-containing protein [Boeremia exigua]KAH6620198.1 Cenp-O kinetochore centromere component-domain-containing protein [Boeremia exigua]
MESAEQLDSDISELHARIATLKAHRANLSSVLLAQPHIAARLGNDAIAKRLIDHQSTRNLENTYRACAGVTAYKVKDPDPRAARNGDILGISIEVPVNGGFIDTYHVLLTVTDSNRLRIHKHTIPTSIPVQQLANKWLPQGTANGDGLKEAEQDLVKFGRALRRELVSWHMRLQTVQDLRKEAMLPDADAGDDETDFISGGRVMNAFVSDDSSDAEEEDSNGPIRILDLEADAAVRQVTITWSDGRTALLAVTKDGRVEKATCRARGGGRDGVSSTKAIGPLSGLLRRLSL